MIIIMYIEQNNIWYYEILSYAYRFPHIKHVLQGYGITEATGAVCRETEMAHKEGSVGQVILGINVKVKTFQLTILCT